jgi:hypothetical protein
MKMARPYVYQVTNKTTCEFYFGHRAANQVDAPEDLGVKYFTSNKVIRTNPTAFDFKVLEIHESQPSAFTAENALIEKSWGNPLLMNKHFQRSQTTFSMAGFKRPDLGEMNKRLKSKPKEERSHVCPNCKQIFVRTEFAHKPFDPDKACSSSCASQIQHRRRAKPKVVVETSCFHCSKPFELKQYARRLCCSHSCSMKLAFARGTKKVWNKK